jgi:hypothetical protein
VVKLDIGDFDRDWEPSSYAGIENFIATFMVLDPGVGNSCRQLLKENPCQAEKSPGNREKW